MNKFRYPICKDRQKKRSKEFTIRCIWKIYDNYDAEWHSYFINPHP